MKASEVYLKAAKFMDSEQTGVCGICHAIARTIEDEDNYGSPFHEQMGRLFDWNRNYFGHYENENRPHRVLALCLMSAIAADEERTQTGSAG